MAATETSTADDGSEDTMKILLATDTHLGYMEKDAIRGNDSLVTFEEVLRLACEHDVDLVVLGGDLFHDNKPSRRTLHGCIALLRKYCLGNKPCQVEFLSDQSVNFGHSSFPTVNYEDPNLNVACPLFSIHGNHDDPAGQGNLCALDLLSAAGLVNYFGKMTSLEQIEMSPLLLQKGHTKLALYGLGAMRDERLHRLFVQKNVAMLRPREQRNDWFNLLVLHQNRSKHSATNYIPEQFLDAFLDLVFWGHEHECLIDPTWVAGQSFYVTQPGSSIATSLSEGETRAKHIGILNVRGRDFKLQKVALQTVRPFLTESVVLSDSKLNPEDPDVARKIEAYCAEKVDALIALAERDLSKDVRQPKLPLIRVRVDYSGGFDLFNIYRFGQKFVEKVANPKDIILFHRRRIMKDRNGGDETDGDCILPEMRANGLDSARVEDMVKEYFNVVDKGRKLSLLSERGMCDAVREFVDKEERDAILELFKHQLGKTQEYLKRRNAHEDVIGAEIERFAGERRAGQGDTLDAVPKTSPEARPLSPGVEVGKRGRGRGQGRGRKAAVVESPRRVTSSIRDTSQWRTNSGKRSAKFDSSNNDVILQSDSDDTLSSDAPPKRKPKQTAPSGGRKGVCFSDSDNDDTFTMPSTRRSRR